MIKTTYICDKCGTESQDQAFLVTMKVRLDYERKGMSLRGIETLPVSMCRPCLSGYGVDVPDDLFGSESVAAFHRDVSSSTTPTEKLIVALSEFINDQVRS